MSLKSKTPTSRIKSNMRIGLRQNIKLSSRMNNGNRSSVMALTSLEGNTAIIQITGREVYYLCRILPFGFSISFSMSENFDSSLSTKALLRKG